MAVFGQLRNTLWSLMKHTRDQNGLVWTKAKNARSTDKKPIRIIAALFSVRSRNREDIATGQCYRPVSRTDAMVSEGAEAAGGGLDQLDLQVEAFRDVIGNPVRDPVEQAGQLVLERRCHFGDGPQGAVPYLNHVSLPADASREIPGSVRANLSQLRGCEHSRRRLAVGNGVGRTRRQL